MIKDLEKLIICLMDEYQKINDEWVRSERYWPVNMKTTQVSELAVDEGLLSYVLDYRSFMNEKVVELSLKVQRLQLESFVSSRVKAVNSIQYKIDNYKKNHEQGKVAINKCLNDIFGIRLICFERITICEIQRFIQEKFPNLKCIDSSKKEGNYVAVHIYFGKGDNHRFQWELQIWDFEHLENNFLSHRRYKQSYVKWELENKGGVLV